MIYGYARVSTTGQTLDSQLEQLRAEGCAKILPGEAERRAPTDVNCRSSSKALSPAMW